MWKTNHQESCTDSPCSFCGKHQDQVNRLITGPAGIRICHECIDLYREHLEKSTGEPIAIGKLTQVCPSCGNRPPASHRYCYNCGFPFTKATAQ